MLFTVKSWSLPNNRRRKRSSRPTREDSSDSREAVGKVKGVVAGERGQARAQSNSTNPRGTSMFVTTVD